MTEKRLKTGSKEPVLLLVLMAMFAALSFVVLWLKIPIGDQFVHPGNAVCILAALLLGGVPGGIAGAVGMGMFDLFFYITSAPKTLVLKFVMGLTAGLIFRFGKKHPQSSPLAGLGIFSAISLLSGLGALLFCLMGEEKDWVWFLPSLFLLILGGTLAAVLVLSLCGKKLGRELQYALLAASAGVAVNVAGEFLWKVVENLVVGMTIDAAVVAAVLKIPATFLNGCFTVFLAVLLYFPVRSALQKARLGSMLA